MQGIIIIPFTVAVLCTLNTATPL